ncbi:hypothetical protein EYF80_039448 [Liparis tanakae]|uniref:Uncharacterized protein n=1 Tax=Liparis tanakae TaxID=230148 RepID=A0A4Z2G9X9_9TELE|nr:hypothetical protein EYF80_039448 [Liparis tanakae]
MGGLDLQDVNALWPTTHPQSVGDHVATLEGAVEQIPGQFLEKSPSGPKGNVLNGPLVLLHALDDLREKHARRHYARDATSCYPSPLHHNVRLYLLQCVDVHPVSLYDSDVRRENLKTFGVLHRLKLLTQDLQNLTEVQRREALSFQACFEILVEGRAELAAGPHLQDGIERVSRVGPDHQRGVGTARLDQRPEVFSPDLLAGVVDVVAVADDGYRHVGELLDDVLEGIFLMRSNAVFMIGADMMKRSEEERGERQSRRAVKREGDGEEREREIALGKQI